MNEIVIDDRERANRTLTMVLYGLHAIGPFTGGLFSLVALIANYLKYEDVRGTWLESHFRWQLRTFWFTVLWIVLLYPPLFLFVIFTLGLGMVVAWPVGAAIGLWWIYRLVKGFLNLNDGKSMYGGT